MNKIYNKEGFTLIELVIVLAIMGIVTASVFSLSNIGRNIFQKGSSQQKLQASNRAFASFIERELTYASRVEILNEIPNSFDINRRYIYVENGEMMHRINGEDPKLISELAETYDNEINFSRKSNTVFSYNLRNNIKDQNYKFTSEIDVLNLDGENIDQRIKGDNGKVISYTFSVTSKELIYFKFIKSEKNKLLEDVEGRIVGNEVILYVPEETEISELVGIYGHTGVEVNLTSNNYSDPDEPVKLTIRAEDGTTREYIIRVEKSSKTPPAVQNVRIIIKDKGDTGKEKDWDIIPVAWDTSYLFVNDYIFISNGNGSNKSSYQWYISDTEEGEYGKIINETEMKFNPGEARIGKYIKVGVTPKGNEVSSNIGTEVLSDGILINKDPHNALWKRIVEDVHYVYMTADDKKTFDDDRESNNLTPYEIIVKIRDDIPKNKPKEFEIKTDVEKLSLQIKGTGKYPTGHKGGSFVSIDLAKFIDNTDGYKITVDAKVIEGPGWGVMVNGTVNSNEKDNGYMFQFDPGYKKSESGGGFVLRRNIDGQHDQGDMQFDGLGVEYGSRSQSYYSHKDLINHEFDENKVDGWQGYLNDYTTEITIQKQIDHSMIMRVRIWRKDNPDKVSNEMWFGDFGEHELPTKTFKGIEPTGDREPIVGKSSKYRGLVRLGKHVNMTEEEKKNGWDWGTMLGFRTWGSKYNVQFNNISVFEGFSMKLESAKFIVDNYGESTKESSNKILLTFDQKLRNDFKKEKISLNNKLGNITNISLDTKDSKSAIITLDKTITIVNSSFNNNTIKRGAVRQEKAGDIVIGNEVNGVTNFEVKGKVDSGSNSDIFDEDKTYHIESIYNKRMDVSGNSDLDDASIIQYKAHNDNNQKWIFEHIENGVYNIKSVSSDRYLFSSGGKNNPIIQKSKFPNNDKHKWEIKKIDLGYLIIDNSGRKVSAEAHTRDLGELTLSNKNAIFDQNQIWQIKEVGK